MTSATSPSWPTSTTARRRSSTRCSARPAVPLEPGSSSTRMDSGDLHARGASRSSPSRPASTTRHPSQHRRHARPRRLRWRGRAAVAHGRLGAAPGRRGGGPGRRQVRAAEGHGAATAGRGRAQQDRPLGRAPGRGLDDVYELFMDLGADDPQIEFPIVYTNAKAGTRRRLDHRATDLRPLLDLLVEHTPPPTYDPDHPLQLLVTNFPRTTTWGGWPSGVMWTKTIGIGTARSRVVPGRGGRAAGRGRPHPTCRPPRPVRP